MPSPASTRRRNKRITEQLVRRLLPYVSPDDLELADTNTDEWLMLVQDRIAEDVNNFPPKKK